MINVNKQKGVVLVMSLMMLLLLTLLGVSSIQTTTLQQRMSRNASDSNLAFQAAEAALRDGEDLLEDLNALVDFDAGTAEANGYYYDDETDTGSDPNWVALDWDGSDGFRVSETEITGVAAQPKYIVEHVKTVISDADALNLDNIGQDTGTGRTQIFRVTARGTGGTETARVMIQGTYGKRL